MTNITMWVRNKLASLVRLSTLRGRSSRGVYSADGYRHQDDPETAVIAKRGQHYGLTTEPPSDGTVMMVALSVGGGASNRVSVAEISTEEPELEEGEVVLWAKVGQRVMLNRDGDVIVTPAPGRKVFLGGGDGTDPVVLKSDLNNVLSSLRTWLNTHTHPTPAGASSTPTAPIAAMSVVGSTVVEVKT